MSGVRRAMLGTVIVAVVGWAFVWFFGSPLDGDPCLDFSGFPEGSAISTELSWWPPGSWECVTLAPDGRSASDTYVPTLSYLLVTYVAVGIGVLLWLITSRTASAWIVASVTVLGLATLMLIAFASTMLSLALAAFAGIGALQLVRREGKVPER